LEDRAIVSLREAGRRLRRHPQEIRGAAEALGLAMHPVGPALVLSDRDFDRLKTKLPERIRQRPDPVSS